MQTQERPVPLPNTLRLETSVEDTILAKEVEVELTIKSSSGVRSAEASRAVAEIAEFLKEAAELGITESQVEIHSATVAEGKGILGRGSTASFALVLRKVPTDRLVGLLQVATRLPHTMHQGTRWCFDVPEEFGLDLIQRATAKARKRAETAAGALGVTIEGVTECEVSLGDEQGQMPMAAGAPAGARMKSIASISSLEEQVGLELVKRMSVRARAQVTFRLG